MFLLWYGILSTLYWVSTSIYLTVNRRKIKFLAEVPQTTAETFPAVAIIIPVRNEEANLAEALASVCRLNYPNYHILVINDRSTDRTPEILEDFARREPNIKVLTIAELPPGWLGKNHALYQGYAATTATWMLFTDADVVYDSDALTKALHYTQQQQLDYLTILPEIKSRSRLLVGVISTFKIMLEFKLRPWAVRKPKTNAYMGVGAFMLVRRAAYENAGTHQALALRPDDDLKLGELIKKAGFRADVLYGDKQIWLEWYTSIREFTQGLMKNTFAVANYNVFIALVGVIATLIAFVLPWPLLLLFGGATERWLALIIFMFQTLLYLPWKSMEIKGWHVLLMPLAGLLISYIILKSTYLTLKQGGIYWRDSFYSLAELRKKS
ncbi:glycosyltransferase [Adhaeribacter rhizoryzae]|uniref:Glycosyltransferase n=1 Tax=Adhaeribacter rhizoryzae TaxID=2607907 RepID=A0A5M6DBU1_9BACT|nr:glycosyltransferase family 2 protein [Adhaeribacter rhizoryzae]KAA5543539.1 glycosyltransferase [Adhaeribacter rhizoryzae]